MSAKQLTVDLLVRYGFQVLGALVILALGWLLARWAGGLTLKWLERRQMEPPMRTLLVRVVRIVVLLFTLVVALDKFGFQIAPLVAGIGVAGLGVGIAMQAVLSNVIAGLTILFTKPFRVGEYIELVGVNGQVSSIDLFSTALVHPDRSRVVIPNRKIVGEILHNFGTMRQPRLEVTVPHGADLGRALAAVRKIVEANPRVLKDPTPLIGVGAVTESGVTIAVGPWVGVSDWGRAQGEIYQAIVEQLRASGLGIAIPQREIRMLPAA